MTVDDSDFCAPFNDPRDHAIRFDKVFERRELLGIDFSIDFLA